jgi:hypothetical protein
MRRVVLVGGGFLLMLAGVVFTLQGLGIIGGSVMSHVTFWAVAGPVIAVAGLVLAVIGLRDQTALAAAVIPLAAPAYAGTMTGIATRRFCRLPAHDGPPGGVSPR